MVNATLPEIRIARRDRPCKPVRLLRPILQKASENAGPKPCAGERLDYIPAPLNGQVAEWSKAHAWNACRRALSASITI